MREILFPVSRFVGGSLYKSETRKNEKTGEERQQFSFAVAIPKGTETHWNQTEWGRLIWAEGSENAPNMHQNPAFAWKVKDGNSNVPNRKGNKPCDNEGWPGNWVLWLSSGFAPKIYNADGSQPINEVDAVKPGYFVQVFGNCAYNKSTDSPGVYLNYSAVAFSAYGPEIQLSAGVDAAAVGFGKGPLPQGASTTPVAGMTGAPTTTPAATGGQNTAANTTGSYTAYTDAPAVPSDDDDAPPPAPVEWPPADWKPNPANPAWWYHVDTKEQLKEAALRTRLGL